MWSAYVCNVSLSRWGSRIELIPSFDVSYGGSKLCPVAWSTVCKSKDEGGLGFHDLALWNKNILSKLIWNIQLKADSLWIKWIHFEFLGRRDFWTVVVKLRDAYLSKNLFRIRDEIIKRCEGSATLAKEMLEKWFKRNGTSDAYEFFQPNGTKLFWYKAIWKSYITLRFSITLWFALHGRLKKVERSSLGNRTRLACF